jgi:hypothetical protein
MKKYALFYPETGERVPGWPEMDTANDVVVLVLEQRDFEQIKPSGEGDFAALLSPHTGVILVVREVEDVADE